MVWQRPEALRAVKEGPRAFLRTGRKFGAAKIAYHQGMACHNEPRLLRACFVPDQKGDGLRRVSGRVQDFDRHVAEFENLPIPHAAERRRGHSIVEKDILRTRRLRERAASGNMISMD